MQCNGSNYVSSHSLQIMVIDIKCTTSTSICSCPVEKCQPILSLIHTIYLRISLLESIRLTLMIKFIQTHKLRLFGFHDVIFLSSRAPAFHPEPPVFDTELEVITSEETPFEVCDTFHQDFT